MIARFVRRAVMPGLLGLFGLLFPLPAGAAGQAEVLLQEARARRALAEFEEAVALLERALRSTDDPALLARIHFALGVNLAVIGKTDAAEAAFRQALTLDPLIDADPERFKTATVALFRRVRRQLAGRLAVTSSCRGAEVFVDGKRLGVVPYRQSQAIGRSRVRVRCGDGREHVETVTVAVAQRATVHARFSPAVGASTDLAPSSGIRPWAWGAAAASVVALGLGVGFGAAAKSDHDAWRAEQQDPARWDDLRASGRTKALTANISLGVAAALAATSVVLFILDRRQAPEARSAAATGPTADAPSTRGWP